jgi:GNAT superfamily N-acetyltransferase
MTTVKKFNLPSSRQYQYVRARQLEGTYPGDRMTGTWPITAWRVSWGWGGPPEKAWPYRTSIWPPPEPAQIDILARRNLGFRYQRVRSLYECKFVLAYHSPVAVSIDITRSWFDAPKGRIPERRHGEPTVASHSVTLTGYDDSKQQLKFINSWGPGWGDKGYGYISYRTFEQTWCEGWCFYPAGPKQSPTGPEPGLKERAWGAKEFGGGIFHVREIVGPNEDRIAWAFAMHRMDSLDVEELFVKPEHRRKGFGKALVRLLGQLAFEVQQYPRVWISYPDTTPENLLLIEKLLSPLGAHLREAPVRWAPFVFCATKDKLDPATIQFAEPDPRDRGQRSRQSAAAKSPKDG